MNKENKVTINLKPWTGIFGFLGFLGPIFYIVFKNPTYFLLCGFFSLFSLYWRGKLSNRIIDSNYIYNKLRASDKSEKFLFVAFIIIFSNAFSNSTINGRYTYLLMSIPTILSSQLIIKSFLLYYYDKNTK